MKKLTKDIWIKIALSLIGVLAATLVYVPNYALVDQGLKDRCTIFFIVATLVVLLLRFIHCFLDGKTDLTIITDR